MFIIFNLFVIFRKSFEPLKIPANTFVNIWKHSASNFFKFARNLRLILCSTSYSSLIWIHEFEYPSLTRILELLGLKSSLGKSQLTRHLKTHEQKKLQIEYSTSRSIIPNPLKSSKQKKGYRLLFHLDRGTKSTVILNRKSKKRASTILSSSG